MSSVTLGPCQDSCANAIAWITSQSPIFVHQVAIDTRMIVEWSNEGNIVSGIAGAMNPDMEGDVADLYCDISH